MFLDAWNPERGDGDAPLTWADLGAMEASGAFEGVEAFDTRSFTLTGGGQPERVAGAGVTPGLFRILGITPQLGRDFLSDEGREPGVDGAALLSDAPWKRRFGGDPGVLGRTLRLNGREITIVGVMTPGVRFPEREELWLPMGTEDPTDNRARSMIGVARLRAGVGFEAARQVAQRWSLGAAGLYPETHQRWTLRAQPFRHGFVDAGDRQFLGLLLASVGYVLLLARAKVANLLLARTSTMRPTSPSASSRQGTSTTTLPPGENTTPG